MKLVIYVEVDGDAFDSWNEDANKENLTKVLTSESVYKVFKDRINRPRNNYRCLIDVNGNSCGEVYTTP